MGRCLTGGFPFGACAPRHVDPYTCSYSRGGQSCVYLSVRVSLVGCVCVCGGGGGGVGGGGGGGIMINYGVGSKK
jgi:hypothetical protein